MLVIVAEEVVAIGMFEVDPIIHTPAITTLYDLMETFQEKVAPEDDATVTAAVACLCDAGYVKFLNALEDCEIANSRDAADVALILPR